MTEECQHSVNNTSQAPENTLVSTTLVNGSTFFGSPGQLAKVIYAQQVGEDPETIRSDKGQTIQGILDMTNAHARRRFDLRLTRCFPPRVSTKQNQDRIHLSVVLPSGETEDAGSGSQEYYTLISSDSVDPLFANLTLGRPLFISPFVATHHLISLPF